LIAFDRTVFGGVDPDDGAAMDWNRRTFERGSPALALTSLTSGMSGLSQRPNPNLSGRQIVIESTEDITGGNADHNWEIFHFHSRKGWRQLTDTQAPVENRRPEMRAGVRIIFDSTGDIDTDESTSLTNADGNREIFVARLRTRGRLTITQVTDTQAPVENLIGCGARVGRHVFFTSNGDLDNDPKTSATNADGNREIFRFVGTLRAKTFTQMTNSTNGANTNPACTPNGVWLVFESTADLEADGATNRRIFQINTRKQSLLRLSRSRFGDNAHPRTTGRMTVWDSNANLTGANPEAERVIYLFDRRKD
jgi:Tol biopolymer transport system component